MAEPAVHVVWTYEDYRTFPSDGNRYEIIDGDLIETPSPTVTHQTVSKRLQFELMLQIERQRKGVVLDAPIDVIFSNTLMVQPDLLVVSSKRRGIISERGVERGPDLVIEILSPSTESVDRHRKAKLYAQHGVTEYWIVDPFNHSMTVYTLTDEGYQLHATFGPGTTAHSTVFEISIVVDEIFAPF